MENEKKNESLDPKTISQNALTKEKEQAAARQKGKAKTFKENFNKFVKPKV